MAPKNVGTCEHNSREAPGIKNYIIKNIGKGEGSFKKIALQHLKMINFTVF